MNINKNTFIKLFDMKTRPEDFGNLVTDGYHYSVVDDSGIDFIKHLNSYCKSTHYKIDTIITDYLSKYSFDDVMEQDDAYKSLLEFIGVLVETRLVFPRKEELV